MKNSSEDSPASQNARPRAIIAGHGDFPSGMVSAVQQISGRGDVFIPVSNRDYSGQALEARLAEISTSKGVRVFFTDLPAGSATIAVRKLMRANPDLVLVTGANLGTLLEFVFHDEADASEAARNAVEKGRASLGTIGGA